MAAATLQADGQPASDFVADGIETARLRLRILAPSDLDALCGMTRDPEVMRYIGHGRTLTREETRLNLSNLISAFRRRGFGRWALTGKGSGALAGYCGLSLSNEEVGVELAYMLAREEWGRGLALEAGRACLRYGFEKLGLPAVAGLTLRDNLRSRRVLERLGLSYVRDAHYYGFDCVYYSLARADWRDDGAPYRLVT